MHIHVLATVKKNKFLSFVGEPVYAKT